MNLFQRVKNRALREAISGFGLPPRWAGYSYLPGESPKHYVDRMQAKRISRRADYTIIEPESRADVPLPRTISSRSELSRFTGRWGFSFYDVPDRPMRATAVATVPDCWIASVMDKWGDESYAMVTCDDHALHVRGMSYVPGHPALLRDRTGASHLDRGWWILEQWNCNYSHWLQWHLSKIAWIRDHGDADNVILPRPNRLSGVTNASVKMLGINPSNCPVFQSNLLHVGELGILEIDDYRPSLLTRLREQIAAATVKPRHAGRKIFISRARALWRRLENEDECWKFLQSRGFERVTMEDIGFAEQVDLMADAVVLLSLHGSGLANMIFARSDCHVVEIFDVIYPNAHFYALAGALGNPYWLLQGQAMGDPNPGFNNVVLDLGRLREVVDEIETQLALGSNRMEG